MSDDGPTDGSIGGSAGGITTGRRALMLGAVGASAVISIRPALAQTAASVVNCEIPIPNASIAADGAVVPAGTKGAVPGGATFRGEDVKRALGGGTLPGTTAEQNQAYTNYIRRLQSGASGFTCFASLQMPRG